MSRATTKLPDADAEREDGMQYGTAGSAKEELEQKYPNRPKNHSKTLPFSQLFLQLFNPLKEAKKKPGAQARKQGHPGATSLSPHEQRRHIIERFIGRWRKEVGNDFYPALRLILPDKDSARGVYGLREHVLGKLLVKLLKIDKNSEDGHNLLHWRLPGQTMAARLAGDFAGRCYEVISKRPMRTEVGNMTIAEVNEQLDKLAASTGDAENLRVLETFYNRMNAEEMLWLIRIILKQLKVGATEKTFMHLWHPDGETLFSVSSSLRRVCWELYDPEIRLEQENAGISLMQCFQPQLAQFQMPASFQRMTDLMRPTADDAEFWIEEKLDGERMQMHMVEDSAHPGGKRFCFWSRKAKDYTYLYGDGLFDSTSSLTRHLKDAFVSGVRNLILDGEMITWDMSVDKIVPFGTLKSAALAEQHNQSGSDASGHRPLFRVFDILYLNGKPLTQYTLRDRHKALEKVVKSVHRRLEVHTYVAATSPDAIEPMLRDVVANASEGLVLKNPRSMYRLNSRNDDWLKVKPEYMSEFGESLDCVIIGGYYGSGRRGGTLSSFLCGLRASQNHIQAGEDPEKCFSFFKVGGGFRSEDYAEVRHLTEGKWLEWDRKNPPTRYIELGGGESRQFERPDLWIRPKDSIVVSAKAASVAPSDSFARGYTLRFPRFRRLRLDRNWDSALSVDEFEELKKRVDEEAKEKAMTLEDRKRRNPKRVKRELVIAGQDTAPALASEAYPGEKSKVFAGLEFCVLSESMKPYKMTKTQLEAVIRENGGAISQRALPGSNMVLIADKKVVKVASLIKIGGVNIIRPKWIKDCLEQNGSFLLPYEEGHLLHATEELAAIAAENTDMYGDSFARDVSLEELRNILRDMARPKTEESFDRQRFLDELGARGEDLLRFRGFLFQRCVVHVRVVGGVDVNLVNKLVRYVKYAAGRVEECLEEKFAITHVVLVGDDAMEVGAMADEVRSTISSWERVPRVVGQQWILGCWREKTVLDEEAFAIQ